MTIETLVQNFMATLDLDPQTAERDITKGLVDMAAGDEDLYLNLRNQAAAQVSAALEARLRSEVSEANLAYEEAGESAEEATEAVIEGEVNESVDQ